MTVFFSDYEKGLSLLRVVKNDLENACIQRSSNCLQLTTGYNEATFMLCRKYVFDSSLGRPDGASRR